MTRKEAEKVARVIGQADNGCSSCVRTLCDAMNYERLGWSFKATEECVDVERIESDGWKTTHMCIVITVSEGDDDAT